MKKEKITKAEILEERGFKFQTMSTGGHIQTTPQELMLPAGFSMQSNGKIETPTERFKRLATNPKPKTDSPEGEILLPMGVELK